MPGHSSSPWIISKRCGNAARGAVAVLSRRCVVLFPPPRAGAPSPADQEFEKVYPDVSGGPGLIAAGNLCGLPALSVPNGFGENHLPTGLSFMGAPFSEELL